jgi:hypothetical protein
MKLTYKNDPELKEYMIAEAIAHREADEFVKGTYGIEDGSTWKGCAVGCAIQSLNKRLNTDSETNNHSFLDEQSLYPEWLARLQDTFFEGLSGEESLTWPERFSRAIPVGIPFEALEPVKWTFCAYLMKENIDLVQALDIDESLKTQVIDAIRGVLRVHETALETGVWDENAAARSARSARSARAEAAWSAARSAARSAWSAAEAARAEAAAEAAWSAARSARAAAHTKHSTELLRLLEEAKINNK